MLVFGYPDSKYQLRQTEEFERGKSAVEGRALGLETGCLLRSLGLAQELYLSLEKGERR